MRPDISAGDRSGVDCRAYKNGLVIGGWYDSTVGIEPMFVSWEEIDELRRKGKRRVEYDWIAAC